MKYKLLGNSGLRVSEICLGAMSFGENWGWGASAGESARIFSSYVSRGGNFIDTANRYTNGQSEEITGKLISNDRDKIVLATKYTLNTNPGDPNAWGNHRKNLRQAVEASLKRLGTDYIDLLWVHLWDFTTSPEEVMRALDDMIRQGKVLYIGISDAPAWLIAESNTLAELRAWTQFTAIQIEYSLIERTVEHELIPYSRYKNIPVLAWGPLGGGVLTGKYKGGTDSQRAESNKRRINERNDKIVDKVLEIAAQTGKTPAQIALNWLLRQDDRIIPIVGASKSSQMEDSLGAIDFELSKEHLAELDEVSNPGTIFPYTMWERPKFIETILTSGISLQGWKRPFDKR